MRVRALIDAHPDEAYVLVYGDIDRFKAYNDLFGTSAGDSLLADIGEMIRRNLPSNAAAARLRADHFIGCFPRSLFDADRMLAVFNDWFAAYRQDFTFFVRMGVYSIDDPELVAKMEKLLDMLEDNDDVQNVWHSCSNVD